MYLTAFDAHCMLQAAQPCKHTLAISKRNAITADPGAQLGRKSNALGSGMQYAKQGDTRRLLSTG